MRAAWPGVSAGAAPAGSRARTGDGGLPVLVADACFKTLSRARGAIRWRAVGARHGWNRWPGALTLLRHDRYRRGVLCASTALSLCMGIGTAAADDWSVGTMTDLGTVAGDLASAVAVSADGSVIVGQHLDSMFLPHALSWANGGATPIELDTLGGSYSSANAVSADGSVIVGLASIAAGPFHAVSWTNGATTPTDLGTLAGGEGYGSSAAAVSADGSVIVGSASNAAGYSHAVSWTDGATVPTDLGTLTGGNYSSANAVSADGSVIAGAATNAVGYTHAASWVGGATTPTDLGTLGGQSSYANAVSADGSVIIGTAQIVSGYQHAVSWSNGATTPTDLGTLGGTSSSASAVSADGSVIVGSAANAANQYRAVSWIGGATTPTDLGTLGGGGGQANSVSADGSVIVGSAANAANQYHAVSWTAGTTTPTDLGTLGGSNSNATAVSADGSVIVGSSSTATGPTHAFVLRTRAAAPMQDLDNIYLSMPLLADDTAVAFDRQAGMLSDMLGAQCRVAPGASWCLDTTLSGFAVSSQQNALIGRLSLGYALSGEVTAGLALAVTAKDSIGAFDIAATPAFGLWSTYSAGGAAGTGFQADLAIAYGKTHADITRGLGLDNVVAVTGTADLATLAARAGIGYGLQEGQWLLTPSLALAAYRTSRSAYDEDANADFPARYESLTSDLTTATLSLGGERPISDRQRIGLNAGIVADLDYGKAGLQGTSTIPGMGTISQTETLGRNKARPFLAASYAIDTSPGSTLHVDAGISRAAYGSKPGLSLDIGYGTAF
ncbi:MAG: hypothetical protein EKK31_31905 [Hyphomicrobiales bacterium]|nr:MAG: hypothetical protein EKK31_31905 [Hyphomicrobiales bacterium]